MMAMGWGTHYTFGVFFEALLRDFGWTRAVTSAAYSVGSILYGIFSVITGRLTDKLGPRVVGTFFSLLLAAGFLLMSLTTSVWQLFLFYGILCGIGSGGFWAPMLSPVAKWFMTRRGMMIGIVTSGIGVGTLVIVPLISRSIASLGWRKSYIILGTAVLVITVVASQFLKRDPHQMGLQPYGSSDARPDRLARRTVDSSFEEAAKLRQFWMLCGIYFSYGFYMCTVAVHIVTHATGMGISAVNAANILAISGGLGIAGRIMVGSASDRLGAKPSIILSIALMAAGLVWLLFARDLWMFYLFAVVFGFGYGSLSALQAPATAELFGLRSVGILIGCFSFSYTLGGSMGPFFAGYIFDSTKSYTLAFIICVIISIAGLMLALLLSPVRKEPGIDQGRSTGIGQSQR